VLVFDLLAGKLVAAVGAQQQAPSGDAAPPQRCSACGGPSPPSPAAVAAAKAIAAMSHVTALFYDQQSHRLITGGADGRVHAWGL
jgi:hypothetical protein